jgi:TonB family protein
VGSGGFPAPGYPLEAELRHQTGTVVVTIQFNSDGGVSEVDVIQSSGVSSLDSNTERWIRGHWQNPNFAGRTVSVPINYHLHGV